MRAICILPLLVVLSACSLLNRVDEEERCLDLTAPKAKATLSGLLTVQIFAGPPNYESVAGGDTEERTFILELPKRLCASDGEFIEDSTKFDRVQVSSSDPGLMGVLEAAQGHQVTVHGEAFGAQTGHHHAPLVILADQVTAK